MKKKLLLALTAILISCLCAFGLTACNIFTHSGISFLPKDYEIDGIKFALNEDNETVSVIGVSEEHGQDIVIPSLCNNLKVTKIAENAFKDCKNIKSITVADSIERMENGVFYNCTAEIKWSNNSSMYLFNEGTFDGYLGTKITLPVRNMLRTSGKLFRNNNTIEEITLPPIFIGSIDDNFKYNLKKLTIISGSNSGVIAKEAFKDCDLLESVTIKDNVNIGVESFADCDLLSSVIMSNGVEIIGEKAFANCVALKNISIPDGVISIHRNAFSDCINLENVFLGSSVKNIMMPLFKNCYSLENIEVDIANKKFISIDGNLYTEDGKTIKQYAIGKDDTSFSLPDGVESIGEFAFAESKALTKIKISSTVKEIESNAFSACSAEIVWDYYIQITLIGHYAFNNYYGQSITIPKSVTHINNYAFKDCFLLQNVYFEDPNYWYITKSVYNWEDKTGGTKKSVPSASSAKNAMYLKSSYLEYFWYKR